MLERAVLLCDGKIITEKELHFQPESRSKTGNQPDVKSLEEIEKLYIEEVLFQAGWQVDAAARKLGVPRSSLYQKIKRFGLTRPEFANSN